jgi:hypothetical protein
LGKHRRVERHPKKILRLHKSFGIAKLGPLQRPSKNACVFGLGANCSEAFYSNDECATYYRGDKVSKVVPNNVLKA